ncbi:GNAT family N-acetyltransferase [Ulvibacter antarcticus]|uniref:Acetyltransferase (GNAT) family protein n=1 Tax=Ulvibacter antarcticus TaxID=442714 RepID=A0A3L9YBJ8_9FLAO|nr:GNAT family N-acetyltransferase [Ulvibacter antarcticus]RMA58011.1 acetyltransferase (GNAT) family protein [Ulvibacter antarcticus]
MVIKSLEGISLNDIVDCLVSSFEGYFVPLPSEVSFWEQRFKAARVDLSLSFGVFEQGTLVAFIVHGIDTNDGLKTAFNSGTGVLQKYRGQAIVDKMYAFALPKLKKHGIQKCKLEVIDKNIRAIRVYERIGFSITRRMKCYKGEPKSVGNQQLEVREVKLSEIVNKPQFPYSWDNCHEAIQLSGKSYKCYLVNELEEDNYVGSFVINPSNGYIAQLEAKSKNLEALLTAVTEIAASIKINNIDDRRIELIACLDKIGMENTIDQFEMEMML